MLKINKNEETKKANNVTVLRGCNCRNKNENSDIASKNKKIEELKDKIDKTKNS